MEENSNEFPLIQFCTWKKFIHLNVWKMVKIKKLMKKSISLKNENVFVFSNEQIKCELFKDFFLGIIKHKNVIYNLYEINNKINSIVDENNENLI